MGVQLGLSDIGAKRDDVRGEWRRLYKDGLYDLFCSPNVIREIKSRGMRLVGHVARMGERRGAYRNLVAISGGKGPLGKPKYRWKDNIKTDPQDRMGRYGLH
jgi:hypothetical protein